MNEYTRTISHLDSLIKSNSSTKSILRSKINKYASIDSKNGYKNNPAAQTVRINNNLDPTKDPNALIKLNTPRGYDDSYTEVFDLFNKNNDDKMPRKPKAKDVPEPFKSPSLTDGPELFAPQIVQSNEVELVDNGPPKVYTTKPDLSMFKQSSDPKMEQVIANKHRTKVVPNGEIEHTVTLSVDEVETLRKYYDLSMPSAKNKKDLNVLVSLKINQEYLYISVVNVLPPNLIDTINETNFPLSRTMRFKMNKQYFGKKRLNWTCQDIDDFRMVLDSKRDHRSGIVFTFYDHHLHIESPKKVDLGDNVRDTIVLNHIVAKNSNNKICFTLNVHGSTEVVMAVRYYEYKTFIQYLKQRTINEPTVYLNFVYVESTDSFTIMVRSGAERFLLTSQAIVEKMKNCTMDLKNIPVLELAYNSLVNLKIPGTANEIGGPNSLIRLAIKKSIIKFIDFDYTVASGVGITVRLPLY